MENGEVRYQEDPDLAVKIKQIKELVQQRREEARHARQKAVSAEAPENYMAKQEEQLPSIG
eukprot:9887546-Lingulodinium_polyedra.AAC.1